MDDVEKDALKMMIAQGIMDPDPLTKDGTCVEHIVRRGELAIVVARALLRITSQLRDTLMATINDPEGDQ